MPSKNGPFGIASAAQYSKQFRVDAGILFTDWWAFPNFPKNIPHATLYGPMDSINYPEEILNFTREYYKIIGICKWQQKCLANAGIESDYIYHGVDVNVFKPMNKKEARKKFGINEDDLFVFGTIAANGDKEDRKSHSRTMKAMRYFLDQNPDVKDIIWLYHTNPFDQKGMPLESIVHKLGLEKIIRFRDPSLTSTMLNERDLARLMNCFDVHILCSFFLKKGFFNILLLLGS
jgi:hypothetical protein